jgi:hypothetical protein
MDDQQVEAGLTESQSKVAALQPHWYGCAPGLTAR